MTFKSLTLAALAAAALTSLPVASAAQSQAAMMTQNGCTYVMAQAPGYAPTWHLVVNPQRAGLPANAGRCAPMIRG